MVRLAVAAAALLVVLCYASTCDAGDVTRGGASNGRGDGGGGGSLDAAAVGAPSVQAPGDTYRPPIINMKYNGGPIMWKPIHLYFVWYGTWTEAEKAVVRTFCNSLTPAKKIRQFPNLSNLWSVVTEYYQQLPGQGRKYGSNDVSIGGEVDDNYSRGKTISGNNDPLPIVRSHLGAGGLPIDLEQGVYFVFTSADVVNSDQTTDCGYHSAACFDTTSDCNNYLNQLIYSFVPLDAGSGCNAFSPSFLNGLPPHHLVSPGGQLDSMLKTMLHELMELAVDPYLTNGWRVNNENTETADLCSWSYVAGDWWYCDGQNSLYPDFPGGTCSSDTLHHTALTDPKSHATFNVYGIGGSEFIVQQFWSLGNKGCVLQREQAKCPGHPVLLHKKMGAIQIGLFVDGVGLQHYSPGEDCTWKIHVPGAKHINLHFVKFAFGYDDKDFVTVSRGTTKLVKKVTGFGKNLQVKITGDEATVHFVTYGLRQPFPSSAGFILRYEAELY